VIPFLGQPYPDYFPGFIFLLIKAGQETITPVMSFRCQTLKKIIGPVGYIIISFGGEIAF